MTAQDLTVLAVNMPNQAGIRNVDWHTYLVSVDAIEALAGYDLLRSCQMRWRRWSRVRSGSRDEMAGWVFTPPPAPPRSPGTGSEA